MTVCQNPLERGIASMKSFRQFRKSITERFEKDVQEDYRKDLIFSEGDWVQHISNGKTGKVIRRGPNYVIALGENNKIFRSWVKDLKEHSVL